MCKDGHREIEQKPWEQDTQRKREREGEIEVFRLVKVSVFVIEVYSKFICINTPH